MHTQATWRITGGRRYTPAPFLVAGIVNITPDSFSDGGRWFSPDAAFERSLAVVDEGADMVDLGAESTRPGARDIGHAEEWRRLEPVLSRLCEARRARSAASLSPFTVSIDTFRAETAALALDAGAQIINDVSGGTFDPALADVLAAYKPGYVLGHSPTLPKVMQDAPRYDNVVDELMRWFGERMDALVTAGLPEECICLDPCVGFGKNLAHNLAVCAAAPRFATLGRPLYYGVSRKAFFTGILGDLLPQQPGPGYRHPKDPATQIAVALLAHNGVAIHRVHQVADTVATLAVVRAFVEARWKDAPGGWGKGSYKRSSPSLRSG